MRVSRCVQVSSVKTRYVSRVNLPGQVDNLSFVSGVLEHNSTCYLEKYYVTMAFREISSV